MTEITETFVKILCAVKTSTLPPPYVMYSKAGHATECCADIVLS